MDFNEGEIIYIDKPLHWTSFEVVKRIRLRILRRIKQKKLKVGHAGTLDPLATGVMRVGMVKLFSRRTLIAIRSELRPDLVVTIITPLAPREP